MKTKIDFLINELHSNPKFKEAVLSCLKWIPLYQIEKCNYKLNNPKDNEFSKITFLMSLKMDWVNCFIDVDELKANLTPLLPHNFLSYFENPDLMVRKTSGQWVLIELKQRVSHPHKLRQSVNQVHKGLTQVFGTGYSLNKFLEEVCFVCSEISIPNKEETQSFLLLNQQSAISERVIFELNQPDQNQSFVESFRIGYMVVLIHPDYGLKFEEAKKTNLLDTYDILFLEIKQWVLSNELKGHRSEIILSNLMEIRKSFMRINYYGDGWDESLSFINTHILLYSNCFPQLVNFLHKSKKILLSFEKEVGFVGSYNAATQVFKNNDKGILKEELSFAINLLLLDIRKEYPVLNVLEYSQGLFLKDHKGTWFNYNNKIKVPKKRAF